MELFYKIPSDSEIQGVFYPKINVKGGSDCIGFNVGFLRIDFLSIQSHLFSILVANENHENTKSMKPQKAKQDSSIIVFNRPWRISISLPISYKA